MHGGRGAGDSIFPVCSYLSSEEKILGSGFSNVCVIVFSGACLSKVYDIPVLAYSVSIARKTFHTSCFELISQRKFFSILFFSSFSS